MDSVILQRVVLELVDMARNQKDATYGELSKKVGLTHHRPLRFYLEEVVQMCGKHQYPPLTVLVVDKEKRKPGGGFHLALQEIPGYEHIDTDNESVDDLLRTRVWSVTNWSELLEAFGVHNTEKSSESSLKALSIGALREQCLAVPPYLKSIETTSIQRYRSPIVQEYARVRANGICQLCESPAPFVDDKGKPFLEVHHIHWLSKGGPDSIFNVVGLCPNCHRRMHVVNDPKDVSKLQLVAKGH